jgi:hypothetical protein
MTQLLELPEQFLEDSSAWSQENRGKHNYVPGPNLRRPSDGEKFSYLPVTDFPPTNCPAAVFSLAINKNKCWRLFILGIAN